MTEPKFQFSSAIEALEQKSVIKANKAAKFAFVSGITILLVGLVCSLFVLMDMTKTFLINY